MGNNIILIGMPGAGKSTIGVILAKTLGMDFLDSDLVICRETGKTLQQILDQEGLEAFLRLEEDIVCGLHPSRTDSAPNRRTRNSQSLSRATSRPRRRGCRGISRLPPAWRQTPGR